MAQSGRFVVYPRLSLPTWKKCSSLIFCIALFTFVVSTLRSAFDMQVLILAPIVLCTIIVLRGSTPVVVAYATSERPYERTHSGKQDQWIHHATVVLSQGLTMNAALDRLLDIIHQQIPYSRAQIFLFETHERMYLARQSVYNDRRGHDLSQTTTIDLSVCPLLRHALSCPEGTLITNAVVNVEGDSFGVDQSFRSWIGIPLIASNRNIGILCAGHDMPSHFTTSHLKSMQLIAPAVSVAIQSARAAENLELFASELQKATKTRGV